MSHKAQKATQGISNSNQDLPYLSVHIPRKIQVNPGDQIKAFSEIDRLLSWYYHPKHAFK